MYAVIFKAQVNELDENYSSTAVRMRELAISKYGCTGFSSNFENGYEIAVSYWPTVEHIQRWKQNSEHLKAQQLCASKWYKSYTVQVVEVLREYSR